VKITVVTGLFAKWNMNVDARQNNFLTKLMFKTTPTS